MRHSGSRKFIEAPRSNKMTQFLQRILLDVTSGYHGAFDSDRMSRVCRIKEVFEEDNRFAVGVGDGGTPELLSLGSDVARG
jgi:hypothetical protein